MIQQRSLSNLASSIPFQREEALQALQVQWETHSSALRDELNGYSLLLATVARSDPIPAVRAKAVSAPSYPSEAIGDALCDSHCTVRTAALAVLAKRCVAPDFNHTFFPTVLAFLALESEEALVIAALDVLKQLSRNASVRLLRSVILPALGYQPASEKGLASVFSPLDSFGVLRDLAEHDSPEIRIAVSTCIVSVMSRASRSQPERTLLSHPDLPLLETACFLLLEQLVQDTHRKVRLHVISDLSCCHREHNQAVNKMFKFSENTIKSVLELVSFPRQADSDDLLDSISQTLYLFRGYPCATVSACALLETYLLRRLYWARSEFVVGRLGAKQYVLFLEKLLGDVAHRNSTFSRILDLARPQSDKLCLGMY